MKTRYNILPFILITFLNSIVAFSQSGKTFVFDFGAKESPLFENATRITEKSIYSKKAGFGLAKKQKFEAYNHKPSFFLNNIIKDGLKSAKAIEFIVDIPNGDYFVKIMLAGGEKSKWTGSIKLNDKEIIKELIRYEDDPEGTDPPDDWFLFLSTKVNNGQLKVVINASDQPTAVSGISIYPSAELPVFWQNGKIVMDSSFSAPNAPFILELLNKGSVVQAAKLIDAFPSKYDHERAFLLIAMAGRLEVENPRAMLEWAKYLLKDTTANHMYKQLIDMYITTDEYYKMAGWDWAKKHTQEGIFGRMDRAARLMETGSGVNSLLTNRFHWELGKMAFWAWVEEHAEKTNLVWNSNFNKLLKHYPNFEPLQNYMGTNKYEIPIPKALLQSNAPEWVKESIISLKAIKELLYFWAEHRQAPNGEFGGKFDDDVEMIRWWPITRLALDDKTALVALQKLVNGVWNSNWIYDGFSRKLRDVEHSSEPVSDTQPLMIGFDYGNPIYVERCMMSLKKAINLWTGVNDRGHLHFKSAWYSSTAIDTTPPKNCDVPMNTRTVEAIRWMVWYNNLPAGVDFLTKWTDSWLEDTYRTDKGKPYGVVPSAIRFSDDEMGGYGDNWYDSKMYWHYFNFQGGGKMLSQFLSTYLINGDEKYLEPIKISLDLIEQYEKEELQKAQAGSEEWVTLKFIESNKFWQIAERWRFITNNSSYDDLFLKYGSDYLKFRLTGTYDYLTQGCKKISDGIYNNYYLLTREGYYTDRIEVGDLHKSQDWGVGHLESMYLGSPMVSGFYPFYSITWSGIEEPFSALLTESSDTSVTAMIYTASNISDTGNVTFWNLKPGIYLFEQFDDIEFKAEAMNPHLSDTIVLPFRKVSKEITIPGGKNQLIRLQIIKKFAKTELLADLAITKDELSVKNIADGKIKIEIPVHNIGAKNAEGFRVVLMSGNSVIQSKSIKGLKAPLDLEPKIIKIAFELEKNELKEKLSIVIDKMNNIKEINEQNNVVNVEAN